MLQCFGVGMFCLVKFWCNDTLRGEAFYATWFWVVRFFVRYCFCAVRFLFNDVLRSEAFVRHGCVVRSFMWYGLVGQRLMCKKMGQRITE